MGFVVCANCHKEIDLWEAALRGASQRGSSFFTIQSLGAERTTFLFDLAAEEHKEIDLRTYGVPEDATILFLNFTPQGGDCFAQLKHANLATPRFLGPTIYVYGLPLQGGKPGGKTCVGVTWIRELDPSEHWLYLVEAFEAIASRKFRHVILPAHIAFELSLMPLVREGIEQHVSKERARSFLNAGVGTSGALNVLLPLLCRIVDAPRLREGIQDRLNQLRKMRNRLVHEGVRKDSVSEQTSVEMLVAAMFGLEYVRFVRPLIAGAKKVSP